MMIEAGADEIPDALMMEAIHLAFDTNLQVVKFIQDVYKRQRQGSRCRSFWKNMRINIS